MMLCVLKSLVANKQKTIKLMEKFMAKKIGAIVSLSIIGILILATIIMANVNVDYSIDCAAPTQVWIQKGSETERLAK